MSSGVHKIYREDNQPFTMVPNDAVRNPEITPNAFRLLAYLMSHQEGYALTYQQIERQTTLKRYAINAAIKLLTDHGYLEVRRPKLANGQWGPKDWVVKNPATADESTVEPSHMGPFHSGTASGLKKNTDKEKHLAKKSTDEETGFAQFWSIYPKKDDKPLARRSFEKALGRASLETILDGVRRYADDPNRELQYTKNPSTWLNADAWENGPLPPRQTRKLTNAENAALLHRRIVAEEEAKRQQQKELEADPAWGSMLKGIDDV